MKMRWYVALGFLAPALGLYALFVLYPTLRGMSYSVTDFSGVGEAKYVGLLNYQRILTDTQAVAAIQNTLVYAVVVVIVQNALGLALAVWMGNMPRVRNFARVALFAPSMLSAVVVAFIWSYLYSPLGGVLNAVLDTVGLSALKRVWLGDSSVALLAIAVVSIWMFTGQTAAIYLTNYLGISQEIRESATLEGANAWQRFFYVEFPLLAPATTICVTLTLINSLRVFDLPFLLTKGGPGNATEVLGLAIFQAAFTNQQFGYGAALAVVLTLFVILVAVLQSTVLRKRESNL